MSLLYLVASTTFTALVMFSVVEHATKVHLHFIIDLKKAKKIGGFKMDYMLLTA